MPVGKDAVMSVDDDLEAAEAEYESGWENALNAVADVLESGAKSLDQRVWSVELWLAALAKNLRAGRVELPD